jgi:hypothetical protein
MGVAAEHWACEVQHPPRRGHRTDRQHSVGCEVREGHNADRQPFRCRACVRGYRPPETKRRLLDTSTHFSCLLAKDEHDPPVRKYSKTGHREDCPTNEGHSGRQSSQCVGCRMTYMDREGELPVGRLNDHPHWDCHLAPSLHIPKPMYGIGHRPGCAVTVSHDPDVTLTKCHACRSVRQQGAVLTARLKKQYRLSREEYDAMIAQQDAKCLICGRSPSLSDATRTSRGLHVDHDHATGKVRGLLCYFCNMGLGCFRDQPDLMIAASEYVRGHIET